MQVTTILKDRVTPTDRLVAIIDPLGLVDDTTKVSSKLGVTLLRYTNEILFRLEYEPLRDRLDRGERLQVAVVAPSEELLPPDVAAKAKRIELFPSKLLAGFHPSLDGLIATREAFHQIAKKVPSSQTTFVERSYDETVNYVLLILFDLPPHPSLEDTLVLLAELHFTKPRKLPPTLKEELVKRLNKVPFWKAEAEKALKDERYFLSQVERLVKASLRRTLGIAEMAGPTIDLQAERLRPVMPRLEAKLDLGSLEDEAASLSTAAILRGIRETSLPKVKKVLSGIATRCIVESRTLPGEFAALGVAEARAVYGKELSAVASYYSTELTTYPTTAEGWLQRAVDLARLEVLLDEVEECHNQLMEKHLALLLENNRAYADFIREHYPTWMAYEPRPLLGVDLLTKRVFPAARRNKTLFFLFDGMSYDHWLVMEPMVAGLLGTRPEDEPIFAILPTITTYGRNAIFAGKFPRDIARENSPSWLDSNAYESRLFFELCPDDIEAKYEKHFSINEPERQRVSKLLDRDVQLVVVVCNFIDSLITVSGQAVINNVELRHFVATRFKGSHIAALLKEAHEAGYTIFITSDHGNTLVRHTVKIKEAEKLEHRRSRSIELRRSLKKLPEDTLPVYEAEKWGLPAGRNFLMAMGFVKFDRVENKRINYVVHGGISLQEMVVPLIRIG